MNSFDWVQNKPWAMLPASLETLWHASTTEVNTEAFAANIGKLLAQTYTTKSRDGIAILPISGVVMCSTNFFNQVLGATTLDTFTKDFQQAVNNADISNIILNIDSPGGAVTGIHECADMIYQARGKKPITAYVSGMAASAAYWLASAADEIVLDATASVGSIGVLSVHTDDKVQKEKNGLVQTHIVSSQSPKKRLDVATEEGRADMQSHVDAIADVFVENVARNRNVSIETVLTDFGQGSLCVGIHAIKQGMSDRLGSLEQLIQEKSSKVEKRILPHQLPREKTMTDILHAESEPQITAEYLTAHHADLVKIFYQAGAQQERERIQSVENQCIPGHEALIKQLKFDGKTSGAEAAIQVLAAEKILQSEKQAGFQSNAISPLPISCSVVEESSMVHQNAKKTLSTEGQWRANWENDSALQAEFCSMDTYLAFQKAQQNGQVNFLTRSS